MQTLCLWLRLLGLRPPPLGEHLSHLAGCPRPGLPGGFLDQMEAMHLGRGLQRGGALSAPRGTWVRVGDGSWVTLRAGWMASAEGYHSSLGINKYLEETLGDYAKASFLPELASITVSVHWWRSRTSPVSGDLCGTLMVTLSPSLLHL